MTAVKSLLHSLTDAEHERIVDLLVEYGEVEAALADAAARDHDDVHSTTQAFRNAALLLGHAYYHSWRGTGAALKWLEKFANEFQGLCSLDLPETLKVQVQEGYAYYALYPEMYLGAVDHYLKEHRPASAAVIGIRTIGASLSSIVAAALVEAGCLVHTYTVRPRGHPFDRYLLLEPALKNEWRKLGNAHWLVVDEGPGISGSSFVSVTQELRSLGIPNERVALFPSWLPSATSLVSATARSHWDQYDKYATAFEQLQLETRPLSDSCGECVDLSAGEWRPVVYSNARLYPAVQPQHERRKYLCNHPSTPLAGNAAPKAPILLKFAGLGRYGRSKLSRAQQLGAAGLAPRCVGLTNGWMAFEWVNGQLLAPGNANKQLIDAIANYLAFLERQFPAEPSADFEQLLEMIRVNTTQGLGRQWTERLSTLAAFRSLVSDAGATAIDGRMQPHEWLAAGGGYFKTDGVDHCDDHFYPGCQNIAWDLAGASTEFMLKPSEQAYLVDQVQRRTNDRKITERLPFYRIAYLAFRLGYATMAQSGGPRQEAERFEKLVQRYASGLVREIQQINA